MSNHGSQEVSRLKALRKSKLLDTPSSVILDTIIKIAQSIFNVNIVTVTLVDEKRQWFKAKVGLGISQTSRKASFCTHTIKQDFPLVIEDASAAPLFMNNPLVQGDMHIRFYSGIQLRSVSGHKLGAFCLIHDEPRRLSIEEQSLQQKLAKLVELELQSLSRGSIKYAPSADKVNQCVLKAQNVFLDTDDERLTFKILLEDLLALTECAFGYISEVKYRMVEEESQPYLKMKSISNISWNRETNDLYTKTENEGLEFTNLDNLLGASLKSRDTIIVNNFKEKAGEAQLPDGHPSIHNYCGIPIRSGNQIIGQIGLANRYEGFSDEFVDAIEAITLTVGVLIERSRMLSDRETYTRRLYEAAHIDEVTGLPNRRSLTRYLESLVSSSKVDNTFVLCFFDLDGFKIVNDNFGHPEGDKLLALVGKRLEQLTRKEDFIARVSGDEFVVVLKQASPDIYQRMLNTINRPFQLHSGAAHVSASMGVAHYPTDSNDIDQLLRYADQAMYIAKHSGKNQVLQFDATLYKMHQRKTEMVEAVLVAIQNNEMKPYLQPKFCLSDKKILGFEVLSRWLHSEKGLIQPGSFLPEIQETLAQISLDDFMLNKAVSILEYLHTFAPQVSLNLNVSPEYFNSQEFILSIDKLAKVSPSYPHFIVLEIVESTALGDLEHAVERLQYCKQLGFRISLDDFGTSYSSLTYFRTLPADEVKIDRSFIRDILTDPHDVAITQAIISMANAFSRVVVAEGVECQEQVDILKSFGCDSAQGFLIAKPMPLEEVARFMHDHSSRAA